MDSTCSIALKEWAVVQRALLEGKQIFLLRKGGLIEETGQFDLKAREFLIQPTYIHETERGEDIQPEYLEWLREEEVRRTPDGLIRFEAVCEAVETIEIKQSETLKALNGEHIWSQSYIDMRLNWEPYKPLFAVIVRAYRLPEPVTVPAYPEYFGCKSWLDLREPVSIQGARPVIESDDEFRRRVEQIRESVLSAAPSGN